MNYEAFFAAFFSAVDICQLSARRVQAFTGISESLLFKLVKNFSALLTLNNPLYAILLFQLDHVSRVVFTYPYS
jgi:hypothetical protein